MSTLVEPSDVPDQIDMTATTCTVACHIPVPDTNYVSTEIIGYIWLYLITIFIIICNTLQRAIAHVTDGEQVRNSDW